jgi:hypothetical protein
MLKENEGQEQNCVGLSVQPQAMHERLVKLAQPSYIRIERVVVELKYNPKYGDNRMCKCGHTYYRHFDSYEDMEACGCKYCQCHEFDEAI